MTVPKIGSMGHMHFPAFTASDAGTQAGVGVTDLSQPLTRPVILWARWHFQGEEGGRGGGRGRSALCSPCRREVLSAFLGYKEESHLVFKCILHKWLFSKWSDDDAFIFVAEDVNELPSFFNVFTFTLQEIFLIKIFHSDIIKILIKCVIFKTIWSKG